MRVISLVWMIFFFHILLVSLCSHFMNIYVFPRNFYRFDFVHQLTLYTILPANHLLRKGSSLQDNSIYPHFSHTGVHPHELWFIFTNMHFLVSSVTHYLHNTRKRNEKREMKWKQNIISSCNKHKNRFLRQIQTYNSRALQFNDYYGLVESFFPSYLQKDLMKIVLSQL